MSDQFETRSVIGDPEYRYDERPPQLSAPIGESAGFKAEGGVTRLSIRDRIAACAPYAAEIVKIPEWDVEIEVRSMALGERNEMLQRASEGEGDTNIQSVYPEMVVRCSYDPETGERVFSQDDVEFINTRRADLVDKLALAAMKLSGMDEDSVDEEAKKSSETEVSESSSS